MPPLKTKHSLRLILQRTLLAICLPALSLTGLQAAARKVAESSPPAPGSLQIHEGTVRWTIQGTPILEQKTPELRLSDGTVLPWKTETSSVEKNVATVSGAFLTKDGEVRAHWNFTLSDEGTLLQTTVKTSWKLSRPIESLQFGLGLHLAPRKRVFFAGQYGLDWDTRYFYQFHLTALGAVMPNPDRNEWRWFGLEKNGGRSFRLWKAESDSTPPLVMQESSQMPFSALVYDEKESVLLDVEPADPAVAMRLLVDASGGGAFSLEVIPPPHSPPGHFLTGSGRLQGQAEFHFTTRAAFGESGLAQLRADLKSRAPADLANLPGTGREWASQDSSAARTRRISAGFPFPQGTVSASQPLTVQIGDESITPQVTPLAYWPDQSLKWGLLSFPLPKVQPGEPAPGSPLISFRNGSRVPVQVQPVPEASSKAPQKNLATLENPSRPQVTIHTGPLTAVLADGKSWWKSLTIEGLSLISENSGGVRAYANYAVDFNSWNSLHGHLLEGRSDEAGLVVERIIVEDNGPERALVRLEGTILNKEPTRCLLWLEFRANSAAIRMYHTVEFLFEDPRRTALTGLGLEFTLAGLAPTALASQNENLPILSGKPASLVLEQVTPNAFRMISSTTGDSKLVATGSKAEGWMLATGNPISVLAVVRNFSALAPKAIEIGTGAENDLKVTFALWPQSAGPMDVRRYSNYPHRGQSEQAPSQYDYVDKSYYTQHPFVGVSRSHDLLLDFLPANSAHAARDIAADFESPPLLFPGEIQLSASDVILPGYGADSGKFAREGMENYLRFWLFHQNLHQWMGFWNYGDFRHYFQGGYGWIAKPDALAAAVKKLKAGENPQSLIVEKSDRILDYAPPNDWAYDNGRWGWGNTEGSPGQLLQTNYLRSGDRDLFFAAEAMARHARDVVVRHAGKWLGAGTRHGVQHWSDGNHEERQTSAGEFKYHYFLTGDPRTRQVITNLYDKYYSRTPVSVHASHSGRLQGLLFHWEVTGDPAEGEQFRKYVESLLSPDGIYERADVTFPGPTVNKPAEGLNEGSMFFQVFGAMDALLEYERMTGHPGLRDSLIASADAVLKNPKARENYARGKVGPMMYGALGYAARHAKDPAPYQKWLAEAFWAAQWKPTFAMVAKDPDLWTGPGAYLDFTVPGSLFWMNFAPWLWGALDSSILSDSAWEEKIADHQNSHRPAAPVPLSWQSEYDAEDELQSYLNQDIPWTTPAPPTQPRP